MAFGLIDGMFLVAVEVPWNRGMILITMYRRGEVVIYSLNPRTSSLTVR